MASTDAQLASDIADKSLDNPKETSKAADALASQGQEDENDDDDEEEEAEAEEVGDGQGVTNTGTAAPAKKKKKSKKKKKAAGEAGEGSQVTKSVPQIPKPVPVHDIPSLIQQLSMSQQNKTEGKAPEDYKFWNTQPVPKFQEPNLLQTTNGDSKPEGPILPDKVCRAICTRKAVAVMISRFML